MYFVQNWHWSPPSRNLQTCTCGVLCSTRASSKAREWKGQRSQGSIGKLKLLNCTRCTRAASRAAPHRHSPIGAKQGWSPSAQHSTARRSSWAALWMINYSPGHQQVEGYLFLFVFPKTIQSTDAFCEPFKTVKCQSKAWKNQQYG